MIRPKQAPLTEEELTYLDSVLERFPDDSAMNVEELDGFFTALMCSPKTAMPSEYLPEIYGVASMETCPALDTLEEAQKFLGLLFQHWNDVGSRLADDEVFLPLLFEDEDGKSMGNDWAIGFVRGMLLHQSDWTELLDSEEKGGLLATILALAYEHDPDPKLRSFKEPITDEKREELLDYLLASVMGIYEYFKPHRIQNARSRRKEKTARRGAPKVGRNEPCPCGSGKKFKVCCGNKRVS